ncbi:MAG: phosphoribosylglycinamide formyltransferase-1 [Gammaproteobacteria bacterium]|jgi:phosphoribosylglycinamide formyltransferase-1
MENSIPLKLVVCISGNGSNLQAIIDAINMGQLNASIACVISDNPDAYGLTRAQDHGLQCQCINPRHYTDRISYDLALRQLLEGLEFNLLVLAGFMRILDSAFIKAFERKIINIHPSILPHYKGLNTHQRAMNNNETEHGVSIHIVTAELDDGPVLLRGRYKIESNHQLSDLQTLGHYLEHEMYPLLLSWIQKRRLTITDKTIEFDGNPINDGLEFSDFQVE